MALSTVSLMSFLLAVAWTAWPTAVLVMSFVAGFLLTSQFVVFGIHRLINFVVWTVRVAWRAVVRRSGAGTPCPEAQLRPQAQVQVQAQVQAQAQVQGHGAAGGQGQPSSSRMEEPRMQMPVPCPCPSPAPAAPEGPGLVVAVPGYITADPKGQWTVDVDVDEVQEVRVSHTVSAAVVVWECGADQGAGGSRSRRCRKEAVAVRVRLRPRGASGAKGVLVAVDHRERGLGRPGTFSRRLHANAGTHRPWSDSDSLISPHAAG